MSAVQTATPRLDTAVRRRISHPSYQAIAILTSGLAPRSRSRVPWERGRMRETVHRRHSENTISPPRKPPSASCDLRIRLRSRRSPQIILAIRSNQRPRADRTAAGHEPCLTHCAAAARSPRNSARISKPDRKRGGVDDSGSRDFPVWPELRRHRPCRESIKSTRDCSGACNAHVPSRTFSRISSPR